MSHDFRRPCSCLRRSLVASRSKTFKASLTRRTGSVFRSASARLSIQWLTSVNVLKAGVWAGCSTLPVVAIRGTVSALPALHCSIHLSISASDAAILCHLLFLADHLTNGPLLVGRHAGRGGAADLACCPPGTLGRRAGRGGRQHRACSKVVFLDTTGHFRPRAPQPLDETLPYLSLHFAGTIRSQQILEAHKHGAFLVRDVCQLVRREYDDVRGHIAAGGRHRKEGVTKTLRHGCGYSA